MHRRCFIPYMMSCLQHQLLLFLSVGSGIALTALAIAPLSASSLEWAECVLRDGSVRMQFNFGLTEVLVTGADIDAATRFSSCASVVTDHVGDNPCRTGRAILILAATAAAVAGSGWLLAGVIIWKHYPWKLLVMPAVLFLSASILLVAAAAVVVTDASSFRLQAASSNPHTTTSCEVKSAPVSLMFIGQQRSMPRTIDVT